MIILIALVVLALLAGYLLTKPAVLIERVSTLRHADLVTDSSDTGVVTTALVIASPISLEVRKTITYRLKLRDDSPPRTGLTVDEVTRALIAAGIPHSSFDVTQLSRHASLVPRRDLIVFAFTRPALRRVSVLELEVRLIDPLGRRVSKTVSALPNQPIAPPITASERGSSEGVA